MKCSKQLTVIPHRIAQLLVYIVLLGISGTAAADTDTTYTYNFTASRAYSGDPSSGTVYVKKAFDDDWRLVRPVIFVEGFDINNKHSFEDHWNDRNKIYVKGKKGDPNDPQGLINMLLARGHDVLFVDWNDPFARLENNAYLLQNIIEWANARLADDHDELQIVGCSMGGLVTRYALTDMENSGKDHNTRTFISFDSPQKGANATLGMQAMFRWMAKYMDKFSTYYDKLSSMAAKQMLLVQIDDDNTTERHAFFDRLDSIGNYPMNLRKVAIANGNGHGSGQAVQPHESVFTYRLVLAQGQSTLHGEVWSMPSTAGRALVFEGRQINMVGPIPIVTPNKHHVTNASLVPYDSVPGGMLDLTKRVGDGMEDGDVAAIVDFNPSVAEPFYSFIPTISALGLNTSDYYMNVAAQDDLSRMTPFNKLYWQEENQPHLSISEATAKRFLDELAAIDKEVCDEVVANTRSDIQVAEKTIVVAGGDCGYVIENGGDAEFRASTKIALRPGFWAKPGAKVRTVLAQ